MNKIEVLESIKRVGIVPIVRVEQTEQAFAAIEAVKAGGIDVFEITLTTPNAVRIIEELQTRFGDAILLGAGTVLDAETARICVLAGAKFIDEKVN